MSAAPRTRAAGARAGLVAAVLLAAFVAALHARALTAGALISPSGMTYTLHPWAPHRALVADRLRYNDVVSDATYQFDPWHVEILQAFARGELPLWTASAYCGAPFAANVQTAVFFPLNLLVWLAPALWTFTFAALVKLWLCGWFMWLFLRRRGAGVAPALLGAAGLAGGGFMTAWMAHPHTQAALGLPALFWAVDVWSERRGARSLVAPAAAAGLAWLGGHPETALHAVLAASAYALWRAADGGGFPLRRMLGFGASQLLGLALGAAALLPFGEYLAAGHVLALRTTTSWGDGIPLGTAITLLVPKFFGEHQTFTWWETDLNRAPGSFNEIAGYAGLALTLLALVSARWLRRERDLRFFWALAAVCCALVYWPAAHRVLDRIPVLSFTSQSRLLCELGFALAVCGALALERLGRGGDPAGRGPWLLVWSASTGCIAVIAGFWWTFRDASAQDPRFTLWCAGAACVLVLQASLLTLVAGARARPRAALGWVVLLAGASELWCWSYGYVGFVRPRDLYPTTQITERLRADPSLFRVLGLGSMLPVNLQVPYGLASVDGYDVVELERYRALFAPLRAWKDAAERGPLAPEARELLDRLNVKYVLAPPGEAVDGRDLRLDYDGAEGRIFTNTTVWPRAFWVEGAGADLAAPRPAAAGRATVATLRYTPGRTEFQVTAPGAGHLVVSDVLYPGWRATVDGAPQPIERAGGAFRAVALAAGGHRVAFEFAPWSVRAGLLTSGVTAAGLILALCWPWRRLR